MYSVCLNETIFIFTCFTVGASEPRCACALVANSQVATGGAILTWIGITIVCIKRKLKVFKR